MKQAILSLLSDKPITRQDIRLATGYHDRDIRQAIRELRLDGIRIVTSDSGGYYIANSDADYMHFRKAMVSRVIRIMEVVNAMDGNLNGQVRWTGCTGAKNMEQ